ncbi:MAG: hypothetical protein A3A81_05610 [Omnitrophica bacterium RIFCSPLOWO2_01_FULL_45_10b]|nr:MAG: hypothetical protein A3A81_05610 [Omnitrophica bacterium RIFCSPLOWO2_01_FULL_45_10b]
MQIKPILLKKTIIWAFCLVIPFALFGCGTSHPGGAPGVISIIPGGGTSISIPQDLVHQVARMETLWRISKMYGVDQRAIMKANGLRNPSSIKVGQRLLIPKAAQIASIVPIYNVRSWQYIVIHHSATHEGSALTIDALHYRRGFENGLGYHFLIDNGTAGKRAGQIEAGPRWVKQMDGAHCNASGMNEHGIGICLIGNFSERYVSDDQLNSLVLLVNALRKHYRIPMSRILRHGDVPGKNTECPGKFFPWDEFKRRLNAAG